MEELEYVVTLKNGADWAQMHEEIVRVSNIDNIPNRAVECVNERPYSDRNTHYSLTTAEAELLKQDPRVESITLHPRHVSHAKVGPLGIFTNQNYNKTSLSINNTMKNWALARTSSQSNPFSASQTLTQNHTWNLDGEGVDLVVIDSGVEHNHPEFAVNPDGTGGSRVVNTNWSLYGGASSWLMNGYLGDCDGHGTHVASTAAGNTCGWAKKARIHSIRIFGGTNITTGVTQGNHDSFTVFDLVKTFHLNKPLVNGKRQPTVCTNSWGWYSSYDNMQYTYYRGTTYYNGFYSSTYGQVNYYHGYRIPALDADVVDCIAAGVVVLGAAGNYYHKIDVPGGLDYDNYWNYAGVENIYYHRGSSPTSATGVICVGAIDNSITEQKAGFSETGPGVDIYAPGRAIMAGYANASYYTAAVADPRSAIMGTGYTYYLNKLDGTSMATPQVAGVVTCLLQANPNMTQAEVKDWLIKTSQKNTLNENAAGGTGYTNLRYLQGGSNRILYQPFNSSTPLSVSGAVNINTNLTV